MICLDVFNLLVFTLLGDGNAFWICDLMAFVGLENCPYHIFKYCYAHSILSGSLITFMFDLTISPISLMLFFFFCIFIHQFLCASFRILTSDPYSSSLNLYSTMSNILLNPPTMFLILAIAFFQFKNVQWIIFNNPWFAVPILNFSLSLPWID